ncbi:phage tail tape measure protein, partial [Escherichia coli]
GSLFSLFTKFGIKEKNDALKAMDTLNKLGKEGAYELKDIAEKATRAMSLYAAAGGRGVQGTKDVGVVLESAVDATGNRDTAATAVENLIRDLQLPKVVKTLRTNGIDVYGKDGRMRSLPLLLQEIARKSGNRGAEEQNKRLIEAGFNQDSVMLLSSVTSGKGAENLQRYLKVTGDGKGIMKDAAYAAQDFTSAMQALETSWKKFSHNQLAKPVQELADALNSVDQNTVQNWLQVGKYMAIALGGIIAVRKTYKFGKT